MNKLDAQDLNFCVVRLPRALRNYMEKNPTAKIFVAGGFVRGVISGEKINDVDIFVNNAMAADLLSLKLCENRTNLYKTQNAITIKEGTIVSQIITRWFYETAKEVCDSFDFTMCEACIFYDGIHWNSVCSDRFYMDVAAKRLIYTSPVRDEDSGGSILRVLKYYQRGYRIPVDDFATVISRLVTGLVAGNGLSHKYSVKTGDDAAYDASESRIAQDILKLLRVVDPAIDPTHEAHLPSKTGNNF